MRPASSVSGGFSTNKRQDGQWRGWATCGSKPPNGIATLAAACSHAGRSGRSCCCSLQLAGLLNSKLCIPLDRSLPLEIVMRIAGRETSRTVNAVRQLGYPVLYARPWVTACLEVPANTRNVAGLGRNQLSHTHRCPHRPGVAPLASTGPWIAHSPVAVVLGANDSLVLRFTPYNLFPTKI